MRHLSRLIVCLLITASPAAAWQGWSGTGQVTVINPSESAVEPASQVTVQPHSEPIEATDADPDKAVAFEIAYTGDVWTNARGGIARGTRYLDNLDVLVNVDLEKAASIPNTTLFVYGLYNNGKDFSGSLVGDALVVSNIETGVQAARLYEAWVQHDALGGRLSLRAGLYDFNAEFDALDSASLFIGSGHGIGADIAQSGQNGPSIFPSTSLAARVQFGLTDALKLRVAVLDGVPGDPNRPKRTAIKLGNGDGALLAGEFEWTTESTKILLGYWRYTAAFENYLATATAGVTVTSKGNDGIYLRGETRLWRQGPNAERGLSAFARIGGADSRYNGFSRFYSLGAVYDGPLASRPEDQFGLALAWAETATALRRFGQLSGAPVDSREVVLEGTYRAPITPWLTVQPTVQYVINPGLDQSLNNALTMGLRTELNWAF
jgi:porin